MKLRKQAVSMALAASLAMSLMPGMPLVPASGAEASTEETQETVKVPALTIADTYYSVNGKFPLYVQKNYDSHGGDTLTVTDADTGALIAEGIFNGTGCEISEIAGVKNGDSRRLTFVSKNDQGEETGKITKTVSFKDKAAWASREYLTQERLNEDFYLYVTEGPALSSPAAIDSLYFLDKENKVAAGAVISVTGWNYKNNDERYGDLFAYNPSSTDWKYCQIHANLINIFPTRKLVSGETLTAAYAIDGTVYPVTNTAITVTDKPYISEVSQREEYLTDYDDTFAVEVKGCNVDFSKLNFVLKAGDTIVGEPVSCLVGDNYAYYTVKWKENHQPRSDYYYDIEFDDPEIVIDEKGKGIRYSSYALFNVTWNPETDSIEYYKANLPVGIETTCKVYKSMTEDSCIVSKSGIVVDNNHHLEIPCPNAFEKNDNYYVKVSYDNYVNRSWEPVYVYANKQSDIMKTSLKRFYYLSNQDSFEFSAGFICENEKSLLATGGAIIKNAQDGIIGEIELSKQGQDGTYYYEGTYSGSLEVGEYTLEVYPENAEEGYEYNFYVTDSNRIALTSQDNQIPSYVTLNFGSKENGEWYCSEENLKKISLHVTDMLGENEKIYRFSEGDFTVSAGIGLSSSRQLIFSNKIKDDFKDMYYCNISIYYDGKIAAKAYQLERDLYQNSYAGRWNLTSESSEVWLGSSGIDSGSWNGKSTCNYIGASDSEAFPLKVRITEWYSLKTIAQFELQKSGIIPEDKISNLSPKKLYNVYLEGANGIKDAYQACYLVGGKVSDPEPTPGEDDPKPTPTTPGGVDPEPTPGEDNPGTTPGEDNPGTTPGESDPEPTPGEDNPGTTPGEDNPGTTPGENTSGGTGTGTGGNVSGSDGSISPGTGSMDNAGTADLDNSNTADDKKPEDNQQPDNIQTNNNPANTEQQGSSENTQTPETSNTAADNNSDDEKEETKAKGKLTLEKKKITVEKGKNAKIEITSDVNTKVTYTSSDPSIATVNKNGKIIAKKKGTVTITVSANGKEKEVTVTVEPAKKTSTIKLSKKMKLSDTKTSLKKGAKLTIKKAAGTGKVTYRSSNSKIAAVSAKGVIKAKKKGTVTIFVENGKKTVKLKITVKG